MKNHRLIFVVLDGVGVGELPDAPSYGDRGTNTVANVARRLGGLHLPNLQRMGMGRISPVMGLDPNAPVRGCFGKMAEQSKGKDSTTGHWEIAGIITGTAFPVYPKGFPPELMAKFLSATGTKGFLGNKPASGTEIIKELGDEHVRTGFPIVYTSGDSVFQIACHEGVVPLPALYEMCSTTRTEVMVGEHKVGRVIARPFIGKSGQYIRTPNRRDFAVEPPGSTVLDHLTGQGIETIGIGKIDDLFSGRGLSKKIHTHSNAEGIQQIIREAGLMEGGLLMANLVDFDMLYGHRQDAEGFAKALSEFDSALPDILGTLKNGDLLMLTADHGNDPTDESTDHSREYVPILCSMKGGKEGVDLGTRKTFADAGKTVAEFFGISNSLAGTGFLSMVK